MARLIISSPDGKRGIYELTKPVITVGRGSANDLVLNDSSVSRLHAVVKQLEDGAVVIADRGSTNGVRINGARIESEIGIQNGDTAQVGSYEIRFESVDDIAFDIHQAEIPSDIGELLHTGIALPLPANGAENSVHQIRKLERENYLLTMLYDAAKSLHSKLSMDEIADQVISLAFRIEGVERGFLMFLDERENMAQQTEVRYRQQRQSARLNPTQQPQINLSRAILESIKKERKPMLINDLRADELLRASRTAKISGMRSAICAPLVGQQRLFGILYVDNLEKSGAFTPEELNVFALLASQAAAAMDSALAHQKLARESAHKAALERFLAPEVVEMVAANPNHIVMGGVNQKVSILFADIRDFTTISERMPPERVVEMLNEYFSRMTDVIFDHGGTLDKFLGDGVMALFGAPISKGNDAANAVRAAIDIQRLVTELSRDARSRKWPPLKIGIGINTGIVTAGNIGSLKRIDYTVIGDAVNVAARLMAAAAGGQILISDSTAKELDSSFSMGGKKPAKLKGKSAPIPVLSVRWMKARKAAAK